MANLLRSKVLRPEIDSAFSKVARVALLLGKVNVFLLEAGPVNSVNPFPVPPNAGVMIPVTSAFPSNGKPKMLREVSKKEAEPLMLMSEGKSEAVKARKAGAPS